MHAHVPLLKQGQVARAEMRRNCMLALCTCNICNTDHDSLARLRSDPDGSFAEGKKTEMSAVMTEMVTDVEHTAMGGAWANTKKTELLVAMAELGSPPWNTPS